MVFIIETPLRIDIKLYLSYIDSKIFSIPKSKSGSHKIVCPTIPYSKKLAINNPNPKAVPEKSEAIKESFIFLAKI